MKQIILIILFSFSIFAHDAYLKAKWNSTKTSIEVQPTVAGFFEKKEIQIIKNHSRLFDLKVSCSGIGKITPSQISPDSNTLCVIEGKNSVFASVRVQPRNITLHKKIAAQYFTHEIGLNGSALKNILEKNVDSVYEVYERNLKVVATTSDVVADTLIGLPLEILIKEVSSKKGKINVTVQLFENNEIVKNAFIRVLQNGKTKYLRTDEKGDLKVQLGTKKPVLFAHIKLVKNSSTQFNSYWTNTSLYFL